MYLQWCYCKTPLQVYSHGTIVTFATATMENAIIAQMDIQWSFQDLLWHSINANIGPVFLLCVDAYELFGFGLVVGYGLLVVVVGFGLWVLWLCLGLWLLRYISLISVPFPLVSPNFLFIFSFPFSCSICFFFEWMNLTLDGSSFSHLFLFVIGQIWVWSMFCGKSNLVGLRTQSVFGEVDFRENGKLWRENGRENFFIIYLVG